MSQSPALAQAYQFTSVEVKELAFRIDGLFMPDAEFPEQPIYFVEVQFQNDPDFYWRFLSEIFIYLGQYKPNRRWQAVVIWANRSLDGGVPLPYQGLLASQQIRRVYLDELSQGAAGSLGLGIVQLVVEPEERAREQVRRLIEQARQELTDEAPRQEVIELIEKVVIYKFPGKSRQELEAMFGLSEWKQTRFYQEVKEEGELEAKLKAVPRLLRLGLTINQIAEALELSIETVQQAAQGHSSN